MRCTCTKRQICGWCLTRIDDEQSDREYGDTNRQDDREADFEAAALFGGAA